MKCRRQTTVLLIILMAGSLFVSCEKKVKEYYPSGKLMIEKTLKGNHLNGVFRMYFESGQLKQEVIYKNDQVVGAMKRWYANGTIESEEFFSNGIKDGRCRYYDPEGNLVEEKNYSKDTLDGPCYSWYPSGIVRIEGKYSKGLYHGNWKYYSETGAKVGEGNFENGSGLLLGLDPLGRKTHQVSYKNNKKEGEEVSYSPGGKVQEIRFYKSDSLVSVTSFK